MLEIERLMQVEISQNLGTSFALATAWVAFQHDPHRPVNGEEGAHLQDGMGRSHLPLRGKLGWMTP